MSVENDKQLYLLHSKMNAYKNKIEKSVKIIRQALQDSNKPLLSFSGGKDSIVMLDIAVKAGFHGELIFLKYGIYIDETPRQTYDILEYYAKKYNLKCNIIPCLGEFDCWKELGYFTMVPETDAEKRIFNKTNNDYIQKSATFEKLYDCDLSFIGMRKKESKTRNIMLTKKGYLYSTNKRESLTCCPISDFSGPDIWSYIFSNGLKYPDFYDYPYLSRERIRNEPTLLYNDAIIRYGAIEGFKTMFPDYINEIKRQYPDAVLG